MLYHALSCFIELYSFLVFVGPCPRLKADLHARLPNTNQTALHLAAALGDLGVLRALKVPFAVMKRVKLQRVKLQRVNEGSFETTGCEVL